MNDEFRAEVEADLSKRDPVSGQLWGDKLRQMRMTVEEYAEVKKTVEELQGRLLVPVFNP